jgi:hypothetical protein
MISPSSVLSKQIVREHYHEMVSTDFARSS